MKKHKKKLYKTFINTNSEALINQRIQAEVEKYLKQSIPALLRNLELKQLQQFNSIFNNSTQARAPSGRQLLEGLLDIFFFTKL